MLTKKYDYESRRRGAHGNELVYLGKIGVLSNGKLSCAGRYETDLKQGFVQSYFNKERTVRLKDVWIAERTLEQISANELNQLESFKAQALEELSATKLSANESNAAQANAMPANAVLATATQTNPFQSLPLFAGGLIVFLIVMYALMVKMFGPAGLASIWEMAKYTPSQFKKEHKKMLAEFGKPLSSGGVPIGQRTDWAWWSFWNPRFINMAPAQRQENPHMLLIGQSQKGKTRMMASMVAHDIKSEDRAVVVIDSDGELSDLIIEFQHQPQKPSAGGGRNAARVGNVSSSPREPPHHGDVGRLIVIDPFNNQGSIGFNPLRMPEDEDLQAASSAIVHAFKAIYREPPGKEKESQWNAQTENILRNAALVLIANGRSLADLPSLLEDNDFRDLMLETVQRKKHEKAEYAAVLEAWDQYKKARG